MWRRCGRCWCDGDDGQAADAHHTVRHGGEASRAAPRDAARPQPDREALSRPRHTAPALLREGGGDVVCNETQRFVSVLVKGRGRQQPIRDSTHENIGLKQRVSESVSKLPLNAFSPQHVAAFIRGEGTQVH